MKQFTRKLSLPSRFDLLLSLFFLFLVILSSSSRCSSHFVFITEEIPCLSSKFHPCFAQEPLLWFSFNFSFSASQSLRLQFPFSLYCSFLRCVSFTPSACAVHLLIIFFSKLELSLYLPENGREEKKINPPSFCCRRKKKMEG